MSPGLYSHTTRASGLVLTASIYNADHVNHVTNQILTMIDDYSSNAAEMQTTTDPYPASSESLATSAAGELERLRYQILEMLKVLGISITNWYDDVVYILKKNAFINADFNIWQRGTSFASIHSAGTSGYSADRFRYAKTGATVHTVSRSTDVPTVAESGHLSNYSLLVDCTTADVSIAAGDFAYIGQRIEGFNFLPLAQQQMTLSFWHKHTKTGTYCVGIRNSNADRSYVAEYTQTTTDTWEKATITITASPSAGTWDYVNGLGLEVVWTLAAGTDFHGTVDTWESANDLATSNQVNACDSVTNNFRLAQVKLEAGGVATRFIGEEVTTDLARCKRYYEELNNEGLANLQFGAGMCQSTTAAKIHLKYEVEKRATPSITVSAAGDFNLIKNDNTEQAVTVFTFNDESKISAEGVITTASGMVQGDATILIDDGAGSARIKIDAEL